MHFVDALIFIVYILAMLGIGYYFMKRNRNTEDYYVGGRSMGSFHVGLSVVATDVGGGFSIGLGGLGFTMGLSGSWMLFTGLVGAWLSAVLLIPRISRLAGEKGLYTFPQIFTHYYNSRVAIIAGIISAVGYLGFTSSQLLAGAKLASATFPSLDISSALLVMGAVTVVYTVLGGLKAVIYTDTVQWIILVAGLTGIGIPLGYRAVGGWSALQETLPPRFFSLTNLTWQTLVNWFVTIVPIWFTGMTLYQRIYACKGPRQAQRAWFIAGLFEWPVMAFMGVLLGLFARAAVLQGNSGISPGIDPEMGLPLLLAAILPAGLLGLMMSAYFSAILSTADSCLMAASGNVATDIIGKRLMPEEKNRLRFSQVITLVLGVIAVLIASVMDSVLDLMLQSYAFMVSGLFVPVAAILTRRRLSPVAAVMAMLTGGSVTIFLMTAYRELPWGLDANIFGITASAVVFMIFSFITRHKTWENKKLK